MKNILISGGNFVNKGAEAMLYIAVDECLKRYPGCICTIQLADGFYAVNSITELYKLSLNRKKEVGGKLSKLKKMISAYRRAELMLDVSGYELCSKLGLYPSMRYIFKIALSKWFRTKVILMPQSFGPFEYPGIVGKVFKIGIRHYMKYPLVCYARENESKEQLSLLVPKAKICTSLDLVLQNGCIIGDIRKELPVDENSNVAEGSIALVVNRRLYEQYGKTNILVKYTEILHMAIEKKRNIYLICHANDDMDICMELEEIFQESSYVHLIDKVLSCFEFQLLARKLDYVIAARYHSIVHSYKEGTPCIALGWAKKYQELLENMGQSSYLLNIGEVNIDEIHAKIEQMERNFNEEKKIITEKVIFAQQYNCFDIMDDLVLEGSKNGYNS